MTKLTEPGPCGNPGHTMAMAEVRCKDCGIKQDSHQQEYDQDCRCGGAFSNTCRLCTVEAERNRLREVLESIEERTSDNETASYARTALNAAKG